jgi:DNA-binding PadR family transcriptional regulator
MGKTAGPLRPLGVVTLALLVERSMHPYEMYQLLVTRNQDQTVKLRPGTLYHAINWLEEGGYVTATGTDREGNRPERTTYAITDEGRAALRRSVVSMLTEPQQEFPEFTVAMGEAHTLPVEEVLGALRERVAVVEAESARGEKFMNRASQGGLPRRYMLGGEFALNRARADVAWLHSLIAGIESGELSWDSPVPKKTEDNA